jgi:hypothetical protein
LVTFDSDDNPLDNAELYDPLTRTFTVTGDMTTVPRGEHSDLATERKGLDRWSRPFWLQVVEVDLYDPATSTFSPMEDTVPSRIDHTATLVPDGTVSIAGDATRYPGSGFSSDASAELYQPGPCWCQRLRCCRFRADKERSYRQAPRGPSLPAIPQPRERHWKSIALASMMGV